MKKLLLMLLIAAVACAPALAQENGDNAATNSVTHGQLAQLMVRALGLSRFLPAVPTDGDVFRVLAQNGINPEDGWQFDGVVTKGMLARVLVQAMGLVEEVENPEDPLSWINVLTEHGVDLDRVSTSVQSVELLPPEDIFQSAETTDPLLIRDDPPHPTGGFYTGADTPISWVFGNGGRPVTPPSPTPH